MIAKETIDLSYRRLSGKGRRLELEAGWPIQRIALLSDAASQQFGPVLRALFHENGVNVELYEGAFDGIELEALNPESSLYRFKPDVIVLALSTQALRGKYFNDSRGDFADENLKRIQDLWKSLRNRTSAQILQFNYVMPYERVFGNFDVQASQTLYASVGRLNLALAKAAAEMSSVNIVDVEMISSEVGRATWFDDRLWNMTKAFCNLEYLPLVCQAVVDLVSTLMGRIRKCVVLDLDNTLWGGVIGDLGHLGVDIGAHGDGEPFFHFQSYLLELKRRGIILAVCSKNEMENAVRPFEDNPGMVLRRSDIAVFVANWDNKADNIRTIRERLNIGLDSMVFLDDNPFERNLVRELLPEVIVPEMPEDAADYVRYVSSLRLFETTSFSAEDAQRADQYKNEADRLELRAAITDVSEYLRSLEMRIRVSRFDAENLVRIAQLTQRSNQFNLTTERLNEDQCRVLMEDVNGWTPLYASLSDRFGDHGLISVVVLQHKRESLRISHWLMSCRVLSRGVEEFLLAKVVDIARELGFGRIGAEYIPSAKNGMVRDFYARMGFEEIANETGRTTWYLEPAKFVARPTFLKEWR